MCHHHHHYHPPPEKPISGGFSHETPLSLIDENQCSTPKTRGDKNQWTSKQASERASPPATLALASAPSAVTAGRKIQRFFTDGTPCTPNNQENLDIFLNLSVGSRLFKEPRNFHSQQEEVRRSSKIDDEEGTRACATTHPQYSPGMQ